MVFSSLFFLYFRMMKSLEFFQIDSSSEMKELYEEVDETLTSTQGNPFHSTPFSSSTSEYSPTAYSSNGHSHSSNAYTHSRIATPSESGLTPSSKHYSRSTVEPIPQSNEESESELPSTTKHSLYSTRELKKNLERSSMENEEMTEIPSEREMSEEWIIIGTSELHHNTILIHTKNRIFFSSAISE